MTSEQICKALQLMRKKRGELAKFAEKHQISYSTVIKLTNGNYKQILHDTAQIIIDGLPPEIKQAAMKKAPRQLKG